MKKSTVTEAVADIATPRSYEIRTFGCQMNVHDSERISGLLETNGYTPALEDQTPDLVVFNICEVRENAAKKLYGHIGNLNENKKTQLRIQYDIRECL